MVIEPTNKYITNNAKTKYDYIKDINGEEILFRDIIVFAIEKHINSMKTMNNILNIKEDICNIIKCFYPYEDYKTIHDNIKIENIIIDLGKYNIKDIFYKSDIVKEIRKEKLKRLLYD